MIGTDQGGKDERGWFHGVVFDLVATIVATHPACHFKYY